MSFLLLYLFTSMKKAKVSIYSLWINFVLIPHSCLTLKKKKIHLSVVIQWLVSHFNDSLNQLSRTIASIYVTSLPGLIHLMLLARKASFYPVILYKLYTPSECILRKRRVVQWQKLMSSSWLPCYHIQILLTMILQVLVVHVWYLCHSFFNLIFKIEI